ncbi:unnamed protein product [Didymodactylos carnosus]|uniref:Transmembrane protein n=1 Tax=Didymodactylos carnosus TaxID=1234261 RepID=A0A814W3I1_9BILA|nr:unnamed protein product [Didymodactylos carnosus]CAF3961524.1 unnamed protein product [Didymodactylos carnosus]
MDKRTATSRRTWPLRVRSSMNSRTHSETQNLIYDGGYYEKTQTSATGSNRRSQLLLTIIIALSVLLACCCSVYGAVSSGRGGGGALYILPVISLLAWVVSHVILVLFSRADDFQASWFLFFSGGNIFFQALLCTILGLTNK